MRSSLRYSIAKVYSEEQTLEKLEQSLVFLLFTGNEKQQNSMVLPKNIATEAINGCLESLASDGSEIAMESIKYLLCDAEYSSQINAGGICLASLMQKNAPSEVVLALIDKGAKLTGSPSALHVFIEDPNQSSEVLLRLLENGVDASEYIDVIIGEPWQHRLIRLCVKLGMYYFSCYLLVILWR